MGSVQHHGSHVQIFTIKRNVSEMVKWKESWKGKRLDRIRLYKFESPHPYNNSLNCYYDMKPPCTRFVWKFTKFDIEDEDPSDNYKPDPMNEHHCEWDSLEGFGFDKKHFNQWGFESLFSKGSLPIKDFKSFRFVSSYNMNHIDLMESISVFIPKL